MVIQSPFDPLWVWCTYMVKISIGCVGGYNGCYAHWLVCTDQDGYHFSKQSVDAVASLQSVELMIEILPLVRFLAANKHPVILVISNYISHGDIMVM